MRSFLSSPGSHMSGGGKYSKCCDLLPVKGLGKGRSWSCQILRRAPCLGPFSLTGLEEARESMGKDRRGDAEGAGRLVALSRVPGRVCVSCSAPDVASLPQKVRSLSCASVSFILSYPQFLIKLK